MDITKSVKASSQEENPLKKMDTLQKSFDDGIIEKEEYESKKKEIQAQISELEKKHGSEKQPEEAPKKSSEKMLLIAVVVIVLLLVAIVSFSFISRQQPKTLEEMHAANLKGKLNKNFGYVYKNAYSFVTLNDQWYTQLQSPKGTKIYNLALRYSPTDVKDIVIEGSLDTAFFDSKKDFYNTFNPKGTELAYVTLAIADFSTHMSRVFEKNPIGACDRNETNVCATVPIVTCEDKDKVVLYLKESEKPRVYYNENCIVVEGKGLDLVKGVDRVLYNLYGMMEKEER